MQDIEKALFILDENITSIRNVSEWAEKMEYKNRKKFSREFRKQFGLRPSESLTKIRLEKIKGHLKANYAEKNYSIALKFGFADEQGLYKFFKRHTEHTPTEWRKRLVKKASQKG